MSTAAPETRPSGEPSSRARLLVIGSEELARQLAASAPSCEVRGAAHGLDGVWQSGQEAFDGVFVSLGLGAKALPTVQSIREVAPQTRIVVGCEPLDEPLARHAVEQGADDYILEPLQSDDIQRAFALPSVKPPPPAAPPPGPVADEVSGLAAALAALSSGPEEVVARLAAHLRESFATTGALVQVDNYVGQSGEADPVVLEQPVLRAEDSVGRVALGAGASGPLTASVAARLAEYADLTRELVAQSQALLGWRELAWTDDLTRLSNRRHFERRFAELLRDASQRRVQLTLFAFDIDNFKSYNDRFGHDAGDSLLRDVAELLRNTTRDTDVVCRFGGDEFAVIFWEAEKPRVPGSRHPSAAMAMIERFRASIAEHPFQFLGPESPGPVTISGGLATFPWDGADPEQLIRAADQALMAAKRTGKNTIGLAGRGAGESLDQAAS